MTKRKLTAPWLAMIILCVLGLCLLAFPGYRFSACILFAIAALVLCFRLLRLLEKRRPKLALWARRVLLLLVCLVLLAAAVTSIFIVKGSMGSPNTACDYIIVLGAGVNGTEPSLSLRDRLDAALTYLQKNPDTVCIVSGGKGSGENISEAACMADWLTAHGIPEDRIWQEDKSTSTQENIANSLALIESRTGSRPDTAGVLSSEYHLYRAGLIARAQNLESIGIPARTSWLTLRINYYLREIVAVWYYTIFGG